MAVVGFIVQLVQILIDWGIKLLGWLWQNVVLNAIKLVILVAIYILLAFLLITLVIGIITLAGIFLAVSIIKGGTVIYGGNFISYNLDDKEGYFGFTIQWDYWEFLAMKIPYIKLSLLIGGNELLTFNMGVITPESDLSDPPSEINNSPINFDLYEFFQGTTAAIGIYASFIFLMLGISFFPWPWFISLIILVALIVITLIYVFSKWETGSGFLGLAAGFLIAMVFLLFAFAGNLHVFLLPENYWGLTVSYTHLTLPTN